LAGPKPMWRTASGLSAIAALITAVATVIAVASQSLKPDGALPTLIPTGPPTTQSATVSPTVTPTPTLIPAELLKTYVPAAIADNCVDALGNLPGTQLAGFDCRPDRSDAVNPPDVVRYLLFADKVATAAVYQNEVAHAKSISQIVDDNDPCFEGTFLGGTGGYTLDGVDVGKLLCYLNDDGHAIFAWTDDTLFLLASAVRSDGNGQELYNWWKNGDLSGPIRP
jgi:hypothetical protein